jgi:GNAT superfamily N-acetyltransferase
MTIRPAQASEAEAVMRTINAAYYPAESFFVDGDRVSLAQTLEHFATGTFLVAGDYQGCVYVEARGERAYFGLLCVDPARQRAGIGKKLIAAAEGWARERGCRHMDIHVVNLRVELPAFYASQGYVQSGTEEFPEHEPTKLPCHFLVMTKQL